MSLYGKNVQLGGGLKPENLQPAPLPTSNYVQPQRREAGKNAMALADALGNLNSALGRFGSVQAAKQNDPASDANKAFLDKITPMSREELMGIDGEHLPRVQADALGVLLGNRASEEFAQGLPEWQATEYDPANGTVQEQIEARRKVVMDDLPNDAARASFFRASQGPSGRFIAGEIDQRVKIATEEMNTSILSTYRNIATEGLHAGRDATAVADEVVAATRANIAFLKLDKAEQNDLLMTFAAEQAEAGNETFVNALLDHPRGGVGPLGKITTNLERAFTIREMAKKTAIKVTAEENQEPYVQLQVQASTAGGVSEGVLDAWETKHGPLAPSVRMQLRETSDRTQVAQAEKAAKDKERLDRIQRQETTKAGAARDALAAARTGTWHNLNGYEIEQEDGTLDYVDPSKQREEARDQFVAGIKSSPLSPEDKQAALYKFVSDTGEEIPEWTAQFGNAQIAANADALTKQNGAIPPMVEETFALYMDLHGKDKRALAKHIKSEGTKDYWEAARVFVTAGMDQKTALLEANRVTQKSADEMGLVPLKMSDVTDSVRKLKTSYVSLFGIGDEQAANAEVLAPLVRDMTNLYRRAGMGQDEAVKASLDRIDSTYDTINGWLVNTADRNVPSDFRPVVEDRLTEYFKAHGEEEDIGSAKDLALVPVDNGSGRYMIWNKKTGHPVENREKRGVILEMFPTYREDMKARQRKDVLDRAGNEGGVTDDDYLKSWNERRRKAGMKPVTEMPVDVPPPPAPVTAPPTPMELLSPKDQQRLRGINEFRTKRGKKPFVRLPTWKDREPTE